MAVVRPKESKMQDTSVNHEGMHPVEDKPSWSESFYFNFVDPDSGVGMFTRMGWRPRDGWADALHVVYLDGSRVAFTYGRRDIGTDLSMYDGDLAVGGLHITCIEPHEEWEISYSGPAQDIADGAILVQPRKERAEGWYTPAQLDMTLRFSCTSPPHLTSSDDPTAEAHGHFEQAGRISGTITLGDDSWTVAGYGVRDKSWGPRSWGANQHDDPAPESGSNQTDAALDPTGPDATQFVNWWSVNFGDDATGGTAVRRPDGSMRGSGWMLRDGEMIGFKGVTVESTHRPGSMLHDTFRISGTTADGEAVVLDGEVINMCPTKVPMPGGATFINEGLTRFTWGDRTGHGIAEQWHAIRRS